MSCMKPSSTGDVLGSMFVVGFLTMIVLGFLEGIESPVISRLSVLVSSLCFFLF